MSSKRPSELLDLESGLVTTAEDVAALRRAAAQGGNWLERANELAFPDELFPDRPRWPRPTAEGWEPFRL